jgi:hypothetical protein
MKKADKRNIIAPSSKPILNAQGNSPILSAAKLKAANVPGAEAFLIGFTSFSKSSLINNASKLIKSTGYTSSFWITDPVVHLTSKGSFRYHMSIPSHQSWFCAYFPIAGYLRAPYHQ